MRKGTSPAVAAKKASAASHQRRHHHRVLKEKAKNRVDDLQGMLTGLQSARRDGRPADAGLLEEQVHQMLREWKAELDQPSPASSATAAAPAPSSLAKGNGSHSSSDLSSYIRRMLQLNEEEEDDATSKLAELSQAAADGALVANPKDEPLDVLDNSVEVCQDGGSAAAVAALMEEYFVTPEMPEHGYLAADQYKNASMCMQNSAINCLTEPNNYEYQHFSIHQELPHTLFLGYNTGKQNEREFVPVMSEIVPALCPPPSAFLKAKCALWDCPRPAGGSDWYEDYCSSFHAVLALNEGPPGMTPVLRPGGIDLKDGPLFAALTAKIQGKNVGIPECEGAATTKSPWNAPELFDLLVLNGEALREWLFFDKPRRAFESGNRKQRSLPDYSGRGWHESRKQVMKEFGGLKRSYYMDPQPLSHYEWHLYEYEINNCDACALYRLELKLVDPKKAVKGKIISDPLGDLQKQMDRLNAETNIDNKRSVKGRPKPNQKEVAENVYLDPEVVKQMEDDQKLYSTLNPKAQISEHIGYGPSMPYGYSVDSLNNYYGT